MAESSVEKLKFNVMTINMKGAQVACRKEAKDVIELSTQDDFTSKPDIIFAQELPPVSKWESDIKVEGDKYCRLKNQEAGIIWRENNFILCSTIGDEIKRDRQFLNMLPDTLCEDIPRRLCHVVLKHKSEAYKVLAVSWHGPENILKVHEEDTVKQLRQLEEYGSLDHRKRHVFKNMQKYINNIFDRLVRKDPALKCIVIGGDFNLDLEHQLTENYLEKGFSFKKYTMSKRRENKKLIDNFLVYPRDKIEVSDIWPYTPKSPLTHLDHDPVLASVNLKLSGNYHKPTSDGKPVFPQYFSLNY